MTSRIQSRKVGKLLSTLNGREIKKLDKWLELEISERQIEVLHLYQSIREEVSVDKMWKRLFPDRSLPEAPFQDVQLRRLENHLTTRIEQFLAIQAFLLDDNQRDLYLVKALNQRTPQEIFPKEFRKIWKRAEKQSLRDASYYRLLYDLEKENQFFQLKHRKGKLPPSREFYNDMLDAWWLHEKLRMEILNLNDNRTDDSEAHDRLLQSAFTLIESKPLFAQMPVIGIYLRLYKLLAYGEENSELMEWFWNYSQYLEPSERKDVFTLMLNYYLKQAYESGQRFYRKQVFHLYDYGLQQGLLFRDGFLLWRAYRGIFNLKIEFESPENTLAFIEEYKSRVPRVDREEVYQFCIGEFHFKQGNFRKAIRTFNQRFRHLSNEVSARLLLIRSRYELGERVELENNLRAFRYYMERKQVNALVKANVQNSLHFLEQLIRVYQLDELKQLKIEIDGAEPLNDRDWFLEKAEAAIEYYKKKKPE